MKKECRLLALVLAVVMAFSSVSVLAQEIGTDYSGYMATRDLGWGAHIEIYNAIKTCKTVEEIKAVQIKYDAKYGEGSVRELYDTAILGDYTRAEIDKVFADARVEYLSRLMATETYEDFAALKAVMSEAEYAEFEGALTEEERAALAAHVANMTIIDTTTEPVTFGESTFSAAGVMPEGAVLTVDEVPAVSVEYFEENYDFGEPALGENRKTLAFDLKIEHEGMTWQPTNDGIEVTISSVAEDADRVEVVHLLDSVEGIERVRARGKLLSFEGEDLNVNFLNETNASGNNGVMYYELLTSESEEVKVHEDGSISFTMDSFSWVLITKISDGLKDLEKNSITSTRYEELRAEANAWANINDTTKNQIAIKNWTRSSNVARHNVTVDTSLQNIDWTNSISNILNLNFSLTNDYEVWNGSRIEKLDDGSYQSYNPTHYNGELKYNTEMLVGQVSVYNDKMHDSAVWRYRLEDKEEDLYNEGYIIQRFRGEFSLPEDFAENATLYNYTLQSRVNDGYIHINDDLYVFIYPKEVTLTSSNYMDYFAYWGGTSSRSSTVARTFHTIPAMLTDREEEKEDRTPLEQVTDGWRANMTLDNVGSRIRALHENPTGSEEFYIDIFVSDYSGWGAMFRPTIMLTPKKAGISLLTVCEDHVNNGLEDAYFKMEYAYGASESDDGIQVNTQRLSNENGELIFGVRDDANNFKLSYHNDGVNDGKLNGFEEYTNTHDIVSAWSNDDTVKDKYTIDGTTYSSENPYVLKLAPIHKHLIFDYNEGTDGTSATEWDIDYCACGEIENKIVPTVTRTGYTFAGWKVIENGGTTWESGRIYSGAEVTAAVEMHTYAETTDTTLEAQWIPDVTITYVTKVFGATGEEVTDSANVVEPTSETIGVFAESAVGSVPTVAQNYKFVGWFKDEACTQQVDSAWVSGNKLIPQKDKDYSAQSAEKPEGFDVAMGYQAATYYAKFVIDIAPLTIKKTGMDENTESAIFTISGDGYNGKVTVPNGGSATLYITCGEYTITEDDAWTWRYGTQREKTVTLNAEGAEVTFNNEKTKLLWLSGDNFKVNKFVSKPSAQAEALTIASDEEENVDPEDVDVDFVPGN